MVDFRSLNFFLEQMLTYTFYEIPFPITKSSLPKQKNKSKIMNKKLIVSFALLLFFGHVLKTEAQVTMSNVEGVYQTVPEMPMPPGGMEGWTNYFQENLKYPAAAKEKGIEGMVALSFIVRADGSVDDVAILRGIGGGCDEEALRIVKESGKWTPGKLDGKPVAVQMRLPVQFKL